MAAVLQQIGAPLQLAALFLMLLAGVVRLLIRSGKVSLPEAMTRVVVDRVFVLALVGLVLGLLGPLAAGLIGRDEVYHGAVLSSTGAAVPGATVSLPTIVTAVTNQLGQFELNVPRGRTEKQYRVQVTAPGYKTPEVLVRTAAEMRSLEVRLEAEPHALVQALEAPVLVGQLLGMPFAIVALRVDNPGQAIALITDVRATLSGPGGSYGLNPLEFTIMGQWGPYTPIGGSIPVFGGAKLDLRVLLGLPIDLNQLFGRLAALPEYRNQRPCGPAPGGGTLAVTDAAFAIEQEFAARRFLWVPGSWRLHLEVVGDGQSKVFDREMTVSGQEVEQLRGSIALTRQCMSVNFTNPLGQDGAMANFLVK